MKRIIFHDPRIAHTCGGGESLTLRKIAALDRDRFKVTILTRKFVTSPLLTEFLSQHPDVEIVGLVEPDDPDEELTRQFVIQHDGGNLWGKDGLVDDGIRFNRVAARYYRNTDCDLVSFSLLTDLFGLDLSANVALHIYGCPPSGMVIDEAPLLRKVDKASAVSGFIRDIFLEVFQEIADSCEVEILAPGLPPVFDQPSSASTRDVDFAFAGRLVSRKGVDMIVHALGMLRTYHRLQPSVVIAGDGPMKSYLHGACKRLGVENQIEFAGILTQRQLIELLDRVRWFLYPVRKPEAFGMAPLEAMARGVPAIIGVPGGMTDFVQDQLNGYVLEQCDVAELEALMCKACRKELPRERLAANSLKTAERYSWQAFRTRANSFFLEAAS